MNPADEMAAKIGPADQKLRTILENLQRAGGSLGASSGASFFNSENYPTASCRRNQQHAWPLCRLKRMLSVRRPDSGRLPPLLHFVSRLCR
jgi:hypothetical protein